jgi:hypothetical protein
MLIAASSECARLAIQTSSARKGKLQPARSPLLDDVRAKLERAQAEDGKNLFSSGEATMRMASPNRTNFLWSMQFALRPQDSR